MILLRFASWEQSCTYSRVNFAPLLGQVLFVYCTQCLTKSEAFLSSWWEQVLFSVLCEWVLMDTIASNPSGEFFPWLWVFTHVHVLTRILDGGPSANLWCPCSLALLSSILCSPNSSFLGLPGLSAASPQLVESAGLGLGSPAPATVRTPSARVLVGLLSFTCCFSGITVLHCLTASLLNLSFYTTGCLLVCLRREGKSGHFYSILARSRIPRESF